MLSGVGHTEEDRHCVISHRWNKKGKLVRTENGVMGTRG